MNHIENIEIKNFKSIKHAEIKDCRRVNVFIGYPNVGKSNVLEALGLYGLYNPILTEDHELFNIIEINKLDKICRIKNNYELFFNQNTKEKITVALKGKLIYTIQSSTSGLAVNIRRLSKINFRDTKATALNFKIDKEFNILLDEINTSHLPISYPKIFIKKYDFNDTSSLNNNAGSSSLHFPEGDNLLTVIQTNPNLRKELVDLFQSYNLRFAIENSSQSIKLLKEMPEDTIVIIPYYQIADTLRRLVFFKTAIISNSDSVLLFEEPEAHMFPPYISKFTSDIVNDENNNQFFLATHSPFVMNDLISNVEKDELSIYIVSYENETGETLIHRMSDKDVNEAYQFGYDFFMNIDNFIPQKQHD